MQKPHCLALMRQRAMRVVNARTQNAHTRERPLEHTPY